MKLDVVCGLLIEMRIYTFALAKDRTDTNKLIGIQRNIGKLLMSAKTAMWTPVKWMKRMLKIQEWHRAELAVVMAYDIYTKTEAGMAKGEVDPQTTAAGYAEVASLLEGSKRQSDPLYRTVENDLRVVGWNQSLKG